MRLEHGRRGCYSTILLSALRYDEGGGILEHVGLDFWIFYVAFPIAMLAFVFTWFVIENRKSGSQ
jgi:hypothetical protein